MGRRTQHAGEPTCPFRSAGGETPIFLPPPPHPILSLFKSSMDGARIITKKGDWSILRVRLFSKSVAVLGLFFFERAAEARYASAPSTRIPIWRSRAVVGAFAATAAAHRASKTSNKTSGGSPVCWPRLPMFGHFPFHLPGPNGSPSSRSRRVSRAGATRPSLGGGVDSGGPVRTSRILDAARRRRPPWRPKCRRHLSASARRSPRNGRPANKTSNQTSGRSLVCCPRLPTFGSFSFRFPFRGEKGSAPTSGGKGAGECRSSR